MTDVQNQVSPQLDEYKKSIEEYKKNLIDINRKTQEEFDKSLITLSTVLIGVCLTLRQQFIVRDQTFGFPWPIVLALVCLLGCVAAVLASHRVSMAVNEKMIDAISEGDDPNKYYDQTKRTRWLNASSTWLFFFGLGFTVLFASLSVTGKVH